MFGYEWNCLMYVWDKTNYISGPSRWHLYYMHVPEFCFTFGDGAWLLKNCLKWFISHFQRHCRLSFATNTIVRTNIQSLASNERCLVHKMARLEDYPCCAQKKTGEMSSIWFGSVFKIKSDWFWLFPRYRSNYQSMRAWKQVPNICWLQHE